MSDNERKGGVGGGRGRPKFLEQYAEQKPPSGVTADSPAPLPAADAPEGLPEPEEPADPFSMVNLARRQPQIMLVLRKKDGNCKALGYSYLVGIDFDPSEHVVLEFTGHKVTIRGRNLLPLFKGLVAHKIGLVQEVDERTDASEEKATVVSSIKIEDTD